MIEVDGVAYLTTSEAAKMLGTKPAAIRKLVFAGKLTPYRKAFIKENLFPLANIEALKHAHPKPSKP